MGDLRNLGWKDMSSHQFPFMDTPLNPSALGYLPLTPANLPAHSKRLQPYPAPHPFLPATHKFPTTPPTFSSISPSPFLHFPPSYIIHSIPNSTRNPNSCQLLSRSSVSLKLPPQSGPASSVPPAPTPLDSFPSRRRSWLPAPRPLPSVPPSFLTPPSARLWVDHSSTVARGPIPRKDEEAPSAPPLGPLPAPPQLPSSGDGICRPRCRRPSPSGRREEKASPGAAQTVWEFPGRRGGEGRWVGRSAGRRQGERAAPTTPGAPRQQPPRTAPAPANNRLRPQRSGSYRRRHVRTEPGAGWEMESTW